MRLREAIEEAGRRLAAGGVDQPRREARLLAAHLLGLEISSWLPDPDAAIDDQAYFHLVDRRAAREPLAFITGRRGFWTLDLAVSPATLVPRADSETLIEAALAVCPDRHGVTRILDLGTGTGCLLLAALVEFPAAFGVGVDVSPEAAGLAAGNALRCGLAGRAAFLAGDWASSLAGRFDLILSNPPYIPTGDIRSLMPEVGRHEPARALDGGAGGLDAYAVLIPALPLFLAPGGTVILEVGAGQADAVSGLARQAGIEPIEVRDDLAGIPRALVLRSGISPAKKPFGSRGDGG